MKTTTLTIASIEIQEFKDIYRLKEAFEKGTIFAQLDKPWGMTCE